MAFPDIVPDLKAKLPQLRGRLLANEPLAPADAGFASAVRRRCCSCRTDEADLAYFLANLPAEIPVTVIGLGSNLIVRDGGIAGCRGAARARLQRRQGRGGPSRPRRRRRSPDLRVARAAQEAGIAGLAFLSRHSRRDRRRAAHERRRLWRRDQGHPDRGARRRPRRQRPRLFERRHGLHLSALRACRRT